MLNNPNGRERKTRLREIDVMLVGFALDPEESRRLQEIRREWWGREGAPINEREEMGVAAKRDKKNKRGGK